MTLLAKVNARLQDFHLHPAFINQQTGRLQRTVADFPSPLDAFVIDAWLEQLGKPSPESSSPVYVANTALHRTARELRAVHIADAYDEGKILTHAENYSRIAGRIIGHDRRREFIESCGMEVPEPRDPMTVEGISQRMADPRWCRRALRKSWTRASENAKRELGVIRKGREPYASDQAVRHIAIRDRRSREWLKSMQAVNDAGDQLSLLELAEHSIANPKIRRGEFMVRARGFEEVAQVHGHVAVFVTMTTPSRFHAQLSTGGKNPQHDAERIREGQAWLCQQWSRVRAKLKRISVLYYGFRIAEPHHDGTPHWHLLAFMRAHDAQTFRTVCAGAWLKESPDEPGARTHRIRFEEIDAAKGSATGYIAKYISKNIDGHGSIGNVESDETGLQVCDSTKRVNAWSRINGIRQFQQLGGPGITLYREFRRLREVVSDPDMERCRAAADKGNFRSYVFAVGGIAVGQKTNPRLAKEETGQRNHYGEFKPPQIVGISYASARELTRQQTWRIKRRDPEQTPARKPSSFQDSMLDANVGGLIKSQKPASGILGPASLSEVAKQIDGALDALPAWAKPYSGEKPHERIRRYSRERSAADGIWLRLFSDLGPVSITIRSPGAATSGDPATWTSAETSQAGPFDA